MKNTTFALYTCATDTGNARSIKHNKTDSNSHRQHSTIRINENSQTTRQMSLKYKRDIMVRTSFQIKKRYIKIRTLKHKVKYYRIENLPPFLKSV